VINQGRFNGGIGAGVKFIDNDEIMPANPALERKTGEFLRLMSTMGGHYRGFNLL
jgi:hypothetical protein